jgi:nucleotide-binding universal stress UspA family protein
MAEVPKKILLATDGSEDASAATQAAVDLAKRGGAELYVVHAFEFIPPREYMSVALRLRPPSWFTGQGQRLLDDQVGKIEAEGAKVTGAQVRMGPPVDQILNAADEIGADLMVVGRRGLGGVRRLLMGSVSEGIVHNARCPVLVLRGEESAWPPSRVIMADDTSEDARKAAELAAGIGSLFGAKGSLVQVYPRLLKDPRTNGSLESRMIEHALKGAEAELEVGARELEGVLGSRPEVKMVADEGADGIDGIALTLIDEARETGEPTLISVGSRGLGRVQRARVGSVSTKVVRAAEGPVLIHPRDPARVAASAQEEVRPGEPAAEEASFWTRLFDERYSSGRQQKVLDYVVHRVGDGARLRDVTEEEYVRRLASPSEIEDILRNPKLVETARLKMQEDVQGAGESLRSG